MRARAMSERGRSRRRAIGVLALLTAAFGAAPAGAADKVRFGWVPAMVSSPIMIAVEKGYFRDAGIDLVLESVATASDGMAHLGTGNLQVLEGGVQANFFNAVASRYPIAIAGDRASTPLGHLVMVRADLAGEIKSLKHLKGRTLGIAGQGSIIAYEMDKLLRSAGLTLADTSVKVIPFPQIAVAFANKVVDVSDVYAPLTYQLEQQKLAVRLADPDDVLKSMVVAVTILNTDWAKQNVGVVQRLFVALMRGTREYCQAFHGGPNRQEIVDIIVRTGIEKRAEVLALPWPSRRVSGVVDPAIILDILDWYRAAGYVKGDVPRDHLVDNSFVERADAELGPFVLANAASTVKGCR